MKKICGLLFLGLLCCSGCQASAVKENLPDTNYIFNETNYENPEFSGIGDQKLSHMPNLVSNADAGNYDASFSTAKSTKTNVASPFTSDTPWHTYAVNETDANKSVESLMREKYQPPEEDKYNVEWGINPAGDNVRLLYPLEDYAQANEVDTVNTYVNASPTGQTSQTGVHTQQGISSTSGESNTSSPSNTSGDSGDKTLTSEEDKTLRLQISELARGFKFEYDAQGNQLYYWQADLQGKIHNIPMCPTLEGDHASGSMYDAWNNDIRQYCDYCQDVTGVPAKEEPEPTPEPARVEIQGKG